MRVRDYDSNTPRGCANCAISRFWIGAFPRVVLAEGEYRAIAKNEGKVYERPFNVVNGVDGEVEVIAR